MKILSIGTDRKLFEEGSAVRARQIEYAKKWEEIHIVVFSIKSEIKKIRIQISDNVWVYSTGSLSKLFYILDAIKIGRKILRLGNYVITCQDPFETGFVGWRLAKKFKATLELQIHTDIGSPYFTSLKLGWRLASLNFIRFQLAGFLLPKASKVRVVSSRIKDYLVSHFKIFQDKIEIRPIKIDEEKILASAIFPENDLRKKYPQFDFIVLMAGRLEPEKNFSFALEIWREVVKKNLRAGLIIVGSGSISDVLKLQVAGYKLQDSVVFEPWTENLFSYYKTADIFLNTSFYEGYGMTLAEAAVADCPIVSSDVGIINELFQSGKKVAICPVDDKNCFVAKIV